MPDSDTFDTDQAQNPGLLRRFAAICYDAVLVFGVLLLIWTLLYFILMSVTGQENVGDSPLAKLYWPLALAGMVGFHVWFWTHGGQTLGMKSWRLRVVNLDGRDPGFRQALLRYMFAWVSAAALGLGFLWVLFDPQHLAWHDRLSDTRLLMTVKRGKRPGVAGS